MRKRGPRRNIRWDADMVEAMRVLVERHGPKRAGAMIGMDGHVVTNALWRKGHGVRQAKRGERLL